MVIHPFNKTRVAVLGNESAGLSRLISGMGLKLYIANMAQDI
jgi:nicotinamide riboside kinase